MRDQALIYAGLVAFLGLVTFPLSYNIGKHARPPELKLPSEAKQCVAPVKYMRESHMALLMDWRDQVVRNGIRTYKTYNISLTGTCMRQCHAGKQEFCDRCHNYVGVKGPYCMDCHLDPKLVGQTIVLRRLPAGPGSHGAATP